MANAVALFNSQSDERYREALPPAAQFRRPLENGAVGYEDKYGVIHLDFSTDDESGDVVEVGSAADDNEQNVVRGYGKNFRWGTEGALNSRERKAVPQITEHPRQRAALFQHEKVPGTTGRSRLGAKSS